MNSSRQRREARMRTESRLGCSSVGSWRNSSAAASSVALMQAEYSDTPRSVLEFKCASSRFASSVHSLGARRRRTRSDRAAQATAACQVAAYFARPQSCLNDIEAYSWAHYSAAELTTFGHTVQMMAA